MLVLTFATGGTGNCAQVDGVPYVYARTRLGGFVLPARCAHRGGPLHLADFEPGGTRLVCPWHERKTSVTRLRKAGLPAVRRGDVVTAVFPDARHHMITYVPMSGALCAADRGTGERPA